MNTITSDDLQYRTEEVLRRVAAGETMTITVEGEPVAEIGPVTSTGVPADPELIKV